MPPTDYTHLSREQLIERLQALEQENALQRFVIDAAPMQISYVDQHQHYRLLNSAYENWFGMDHDAMLNQHVSQILGAPTYAAIQHRLEQALAGEHIRYQYHLHRPHLGERDLLVTYIPHRVDDRVIGICVVVQDISAIEQSKLALVDSERRFRSLFEQAPVAINLVGLDGTPFLVNFASQRLFGYSREELTSMPYTRWTHPDDVAPGLERVQKLHSGEADQFTMEKRYLRKNGATIWAHVTVSAVRNKQGNAEYFIAIIQDISQRRQTEITLQEHQDRLELTESIASLGSWELNLASQQLTWSDETYRIFGLQPDAFPATYETFLACVHPEDRLEVDQAYTASLHDGCDRYEIEHRIVRRDNGETRRVREKCRHFRDAAGNIVRSVGMVQDITEARQVEHDLLLRTRELEALIDTIPAMVHVKDRQLRNVMVNQAFCEATGQTPEQILGRLDDEILPPDLARQSAHSDRLVMSSGQPVKSLEQPWFDQAGRRRWLSTSKTPYFEENGKVSGLVGVSIDITENKEAEAERLIVIERQRDSLVREVHHRIKNHLQGVLGLIHNAITENPAIASQLEFAIRPVRTIAQVYGLLSNRSDAHVRICDLTRSIAESATGRVPVQLELPQHAEAILAQNEAIPIALVINELITNALKHLQSADASRPVRVTLTLRDNQARLQICNQPAWLPPGFDFATASGTGTGLELVTTLLPSAGASLVFEQQHDRVSATLTLHAPLVTLVNLKTG